ncbi:GNAT family N-acetyltransferase [Novipirellula artificiosorum]|uniref:BioF2-like acetyltransferase domain-containing protein n=1 Tax=Novipirellula artificiosorum TaxID=2528016 RepID=A0A5C6DU60_9BACT|nr:GNAT family N-acetyltransferase [Novipirellula artificiosorum]TWU39447.1 hypothetical protein Poly41_22710 [Novipirellula artificiosorum]
MEGFSRFRPSRGNSIDSGVFGCDRFRAFLSLAFARLSQLKMAEISAIKLDGEIVAVEFELIGPTTVYAYQAGISETGLQHSAGSLSAMVRIRTAIERGKTKFDFLRGDEPYKFRWGAQTMQTCRLRLRRRSTLGLLAHHANIFLRFRIMYCENRDYAQPCPHERIAIYAVSRLPTK